MTTLLEKLPLPEKRNLILDDCETLLKAEVKSKKGLSGFAVKASFTVLSKFKAGAVRATLDDLLDKFIDALEPFHLELVIGRSARQNIEADRVLTWDMI